jgi:superfamily II DNA helicase RecQ
MSFSEIIATIDDVVRNRIKILFVSPERLASAAFRRLFRGKHKSGGKCVKSVPKVSLLCIDECHCLSTWGHNFRPSYLRIKSLLPLINPTSVLALTATACVKVITDVCNTLGISYSDKDVDKHINAKGIEINTDQERNLNESAIKVLNVSRKNIDVSACFVASDEARRSIVRIFFSILSFLSLVKNHFSYMQSFAALLYTKAFGSAQKSGNTKKRHDGRKKKPLLLSG